MASVIPYTKKLLIQRLRQDIVNDFPSSELNVTENEVLLYIDQALAYTIVGQVYQGAKVEGNLAMPEGYLTTYALPALTQNSITREWETTLPQPPLSLPLGYSITRGYFASSTNGMGTDVIWIKSKRVARRRYLPQQFGVYGIVEGSKLILKASDGSSLFGNTFYVTMAKSRTDSITETLNMPDDAIEAIFINVKQKLLSRLQMRQDVIADDISSGATNVTTK